MKYLSEEDTGFKGLERYDTIKKRFNKPDINDWYEKIYRHPQAIGYVSAFFKKYKPASFENALDLYYLSGIRDKDLPITQRGRTKEEIEDLAIDWKEKCGVDLPLVDFYDAIILHAVIETVFGNIMESTAATAYRNRGFDVEETDGRDDRSLGIDFIATMDESKLLVQVKPISFFRGEKADLVKDRVTTWKKHKMGLEKYPEASYAYMIYDPQGKWLKSKGKFNFKYEDLITEDGKAKTSIDDKTKYIHEDNLN